jgi:hypothetical protein
MDEPIERSRVKVWLERLILAVWFLSLLALLPMADYSDSTLFFLVVTIVPGALLLIFIVAVFIWNIVKGVLPLARGDRRKAWRHIAIVLLGIAAIPAGRYVGDGIAMALVAGPLKAATEAADPSAIQKPIQASNAAAIYIVDSFFFTIQGVAYDSTGRLGDLLMLEPGERPEDWQASMPEILQARGYPRHLWGNYWKVTMSMD